MFKFCSWPEHLWILDDPSVCLDIALVCRCLGMQIMLPVIFQCQWCAITHCKYFAYAVGVIFVCMCVFVSLEPALMSYRRTTLNYGCSWIMALISFIFLTCLWDSEQVSPSGVLQCFQIQHGYKGWKQKFLVGSDQCNILSTAELSSGGFGKMKCLSSLNCFKAGHPNTCTSLLSKFSSVSEW